MKSEELDGPSPGLTFGAGRRRAVLGFAILASLLFQVFAVRQIAGPIARGVSDFSGFYTAGKIVESGNGNQLYDESTQARVEGNYTVRSLQGGFLPYNLMLRIPDLRGMLARSG